MTVEPWRVAQLTVDREPGQNGSRGSGYLVAPSRVLTAAHVVVGASVVRVQLDVGQDTEVEVQALTWWADPSHGTDLAVVIIPEGATAGRKCEPALFGRVSDCAAVLVVQAFGFPLFKLRVDSDQPVVFRDFEQAAAHAPVAANRRQGTLAVYLDASPPSPPTSGQTSPWQGMSGGPVWAGERIIGVVAEHHPSEGAGRLTARRIDRAYQQLSAAELRKLVELTGLPPTIGELHDVVPAMLDQLVWSAYVAQVRDISPEQLVGRESELAQWAEFCADATPYALWQADPWAGKTALASWFVTHPPAGVDVVSFFITGRLRGQADSEAFLDAMIEQLSALHPAGQGSAPVTSPRKGVWLKLLESAATRTEDVGRRLVIVVDGLDEDEAGATPLRGQPSIASLLPRRPPSGVRFIVTSRPDPGVPDDVAGDHPLRSCVPRALPVSWVAEDVAFRAKQELRDVLSGDQIGVDVVGFIAASGGGLTKNDLSALTSAPPRRLDPILRGVFGRSLTTRASTHLSNLRQDPATRVYLFAHETLQTSAEEQLGSELARYQQKVHEWIGTYANLGWPDTTPDYAIRGYLRLLTATTDVIRLAALARSPNRHVFLLRATGSDYSALTEIRTAQRVIAAQRTMHLQALVELAVYHHAISIRNRFMPFELPRMWASLGHFDRAEALARTITTPDDRARIIAELATAAVQAGDRLRADRLAVDAEALATTIANADDRDAVLAELATAAGQAGDRLRADRLASDAQALAFTIINADDQAWALGELADAASETHDSNSAEALRGTTTTSARRDRVLAEVVVAIGRAGDLDGAEALARTITNPDDRARVLAGLATTAARAGDRVRAIRLTSDVGATASTTTNLAERGRPSTGLAAAATWTDDFERAEALASTLSNFDRRDRVLAKLAIAIARAGDHDRAEALARALTSFDHRARIIAQLATTAAQARDRRRADRLAADALALAPTITNPDDRARVLAELAIVATQAGDRSRADRLIADAEALSSTITNPDRQASVLAELATATAQAGYPGRAEARARAITISHHKAQALAGLATVVAQAGDRSHADRLAADAEAVASSITNPERQARVLAELATAAARAGDPDRADRLAADAEELARTVINHDDLARALAELTTAIGQAGDFDRAEALARTIAGTREQSRALTGLAIAIAQAGDLDRAEAVARRCASPDDQVRAVGELAIAIAQAGDFDRAEALARNITDPDDLARALAGLAMAIAQAGDPSRAACLARTITNRHHQARALAGLARAVAQAGDHSLAGQLAADAEGLAPTFIDRYRRAGMLAELTTAIGEAGDFDRAEALARTITDSRELARALTGLAIAIARAGDFDRAEALVRSIANPDRQARALGELCIAIARAGDFDRAEALVRSIANPDRQARTLGELSIAIARAGDLDRADTVARSITDSRAQGWALTGLATAAAQAGDLDCAWRLLTRALIMDCPELGWIDAVSRIFPSVIRAAQDVLVSAYAPGS